MSVAPSVPPPGALPGRLTGRLGRLTPLAPLRFPSFRLLMIGMAPHMLAMQMSTVALGFLAYELSGSATALGLIGLGWGIPMVGLSLVGGVVADRFPRRTILLATQALIGLSALLAAVLLFTNMIQVWQIFLIALMQGTAFAFNMPARQALIGTLVGPTDLSGAVALNNTVMNTMRVLGPPLAGALIAWPVVGVQGVFLLIAVLYVVVVGTLWRLPRDAVQKAERRTGWQSLVEGLSFIRHSPVLVGLLALGFAPMFFGMPYQLLMPVFALGVLQAGPGGLGLLNMANGVGAVVGSLAVGFLPVTGRRWLVQLVLGVSFGVGLIAFALSTTMWQAVLTLVVTGAASAGYMALNNSLILEAAPRAFHGRVTSVYMMTFALMPLASMPAARLVDTIGAAETVAAMGVLLVTSIVAVTVWQRRVARQTRPADATAVAD